MITQEQKLSLITSPKFAYARYKRHYEEWAIKEWGAGYYAIYHKSVNSPSGVESVGSLTISEWEEFGKLAGKSNNYLSPTEKY